VIADDTFQILLTDTSMFTHIQTIREYNFGQSRALCTQIKKRTTC